jgi:hypothetical protein
MGGVGGNYSEARPAGARKSGGGDTQREREPRARWQWRDQARRQPSAC